MTEPYQADPAGHREPVLRTVPRPADINSNGHIFGGWVLSQMDIAGGIVAAREAGGAVATVAIESMKFIAPILIGDLISVYGRVERRGRTSLAIRLDVLADRKDRSTPVQVTSGVFTFVAIDEEARPRPLPESQS
jgi:acyl-CoA thioesterase YciA